MAQILVWSPQEAWKVLDMLRSTWSVAHGT
jgi:hypothetical protein